MLCVNLIRKKREGLPLSADEWHFLIAGFCDGSVSDAQMAAMAMAICLRGLTDEETAFLTQEMVASGASLPRVTDRPRVDKHSTGGLGDKVSLVLAPLLACCEVDVPMISGRGLGRTGGTLDKLESIDGFQSQIPLARSSEILRKVGAFIVGASPEIAPADRRLYALRDVTATVESTGLITASILSKKLAASLDALVMDVKVGSGGFMETQADAADLADRLQRVGHQAGLPTLPVLSDMNQPLGLAVGNAIEVNEAVEVLQGNGPPDVRELTLRLCGQLLTEIGLAADQQDATAQLTKQLDGGYAYERFKKMVDAQGGCLAGPLTVTPGHTIHARQDGFVSAIDCPAIGDAIIQWGGGRRQPGDKIDFTVGVKLHAKIAQPVTKGQPLIDICAKDFDAGLAEKWILISPDKPPVQSLVYAS